MIDSRTKRRLLQNKTNLALLVIGAIAVVTSIPDVKTNLHQMGELKDKMQATTAEQMDLLASQDNQAEKEKIAIARYQRGCVFVVASSDPSKLVAIQAGRPVLDGVTKYPLSAGTTVCDAAGTTAEIVAGTPPVAAKLAFTGNREVIEAALKRAGANQLERTKSNQSGTPIK